MTARPAPWQAHLGHYAGNVISAVRESPAAIHAFISAFTRHPDPAGSATHAGSVAAVAIILAAILTVISRVRRTRSRKS
jgi:hypothetical protein